MEDQDLPVSHSQYYGCWWPGDARGLGFINSNNIDLIKPRLLGPCTLTVTRATFETSNYPWRPWDWYTAPNSKCIGAEHHHPPPPPPPPKKKKKKNEKLLILVIGLVEKIGRTVKQSSDLYTSSIPVPLQSLEAQLPSLSLVAVLLILFVCHVHSGSHQYSWFSCISSTVANPHHYWNVVYR